MIDLHPTQKLEKELQEIIKKTGNTPETESIQHEINLLKKIEQINTSIV